MTTSDKTTTPAAYENNPFYVATSGLDLLFKKAQSLGILFAVISGLYILSSFPSMFVPAGEPEPATASEEQAIMEAVSKVPLEVWLLAGSIVALVLLTIGLISLIVKGMIDYTSTELSNGRTVTISEAFRGLFASFWGYVWVQVVAGFKTFLWTLLFIVPGFIMSYRYSLTGVSYFDKKLSGGAASKDSAELTKGAWLTTYASQSLLNILTLGAIPMLLQPGTNAVLYRQLRDSGGVKPGAHVLSWLTLFFPVIILTLVLLAVLLVVFAVGNYATS